MQRCTTLCAWHACKHAVQVAYVILVHMIRIRQGHSAVSCCNSTWSLAWLAPILAMPGGPYKCPPTSSAECTFQVVHDSKFVFSTAVQGRGVPRVPRGQGAEETLLWLAPWSKAGLGVRPELQEDQAYRSLHACSRGYPRAGMGKNRVCSL